MKLVYVLALFVMMGLVVPVYAQNVSHDEVDIKIREEIKACQAEIEEDDSLTYAEKTVAKRNCETNITNHYKNINNDHRDLAEKKSKLNNMQKCIDWFPQYRYLTEAQFKVQKDVAVVADCILLYNDSIWKYAGEDRLEKLVERLGELKTEIRNTPQPDPVAVQMEIPQLKSNIVGEQQRQDRIVELEGKVMSLQEELAKKDEIIIEQLKVIMDLANRIKNAIFEPLGLFWAQV